MDKKLSEMSITEMLESAEDGMNLFIEEAAHAGDDWDESKHKRDAEGKFTSGGGAQKRGEGANPSAETKIHTFEELEKRFGNNFDVVLSAARRAQRNGKIKNYEEAEEFFKKADKMEKELSALRIDENKKNFNDADQKEYAKQADNLRQYGGNDKERYLNAPKNEWEQYVHAHNKFFASDLDSTKTKRGRRHKRRPRKKGECTNGQKQNSSRNTGYCL